MDKPKILISFSGGETSGFMTWWLLRHRQHEFDFIVVFANTGKEREETLEFVRECDCHFGFNTVWIETVVDPKAGRGGGVKVVTFETAARHGQPFEAVIQKYGIPNIDLPHCTRELKARPIRRYARSIGWTDYDTAIGIRADEFDRINPHFRKERLVYPLISMFESSKPEILDWWSKQQFRLRLQPHEGNCDCCWKKSLRKRLTLAREAPTLFEWWHLMEEKYSRFAAPKQLAMQRLIAEGGRRVFNRGRMPVADLLKLSQQPDTVLDDKELDLPNGCSESCEVF